MKVVITAALVSIAATSAFAAEEPFGPGFDGWKFTQENTSKGILCRAKNGNDIIGRYADAKMFVSVPAKGIPAGTYPETFFKIGKDSEPVMARSNGTRLTMETDAGFLIKMSSGAGINYRTGPVKGKHVEGMAFFITRSAGKALAELQKCSKANGGR